MSEMPTRNLISKEEITRRSNAKMPPNGQNGQVGDRSGASIRANAVNASNVDAAALEAALKKVVIGEVRFDDRWFQHISIIVRDMDRAYAWVRLHGASATSRPSRSGCRTRRSAFAWARTWPTRMATVSNCSSNDSGGMEPYGTLGCPFL